MKKSTKLCIILVSVCLAMALLAGALLVMPMLTADDPVDTDPPALTDTEGAGSLYVEDTTSRDEESRGPSEVVHDDNVRSETVDYGYRLPFVMYFDCLPGETVEVRADEDCLNYIDLSYEDKTNVDEFRGELFKAETSGVRHTLLNMDPFASCIQVTVPFETGHIDDVILEFTIYDEDKRVMGVGSLLVASYYPQTAEEIELTPALYAVNRSVVLGSVRFTDPDAVTEEQVQALYEEFRAKADEARASLDFTPQTVYEVRQNTEIELRRQFAGRQVGVGSSKASHLDFSIFEVTVFAENGIDLEKAHRYVIMKDGSWFELQFHQGCHVPCHMEEFCPNQRTAGEKHEFIVGCHVLALDGRIYEVQGYTAGGGSERMALVLIQEPKA